VVARILRTAGMFSGEKLNPYEDAVELGFYSDRWIDRYLAGQRSPNLHEQMAADLRSVLQDHTSTAPEDARAWGWKEPRSIYLLRFWHETMPSLRFLHFVRPRHGLLGEPESAQEARRRRARRRASEGEDARTLDRALESRQPGGRRLRRGGPAIPRAEVRPPDTLGRWQLRPKRVIEELNRTAEPTLRRFGYL
jgi:hypothetical protein